MLRYHDWSTRLGAIRCKIFGASDVSRWADAEKFDDWEDRTKLIATLIPAGARVIEFGAGKRQLERHLDPACSYVPSDLVSRGPGTVVLDLNKRPLPDLSPDKFDVAVFAGVLEYVAHLPSFVRWLGSWTPCVVASYVSAKDRPRARGRLVQSFARAGKGWVNSYPEKELIELFSDAGLPFKDYVELHRPDGDQRIYRFGCNAGRE
jgi:hypothetical protein